MKEIKLSGKSGKVTLVSNADYDWLNQWKWNLIKNNKRDYVGRVIIYKSAGEKRCKTILMHRLILGLVDPKMHGDHKDGNGLNNQRNNLRPATHSQNTANKRKKNGYLSKYLGVSKTIKRENGYVYEYWQASCRKNGIRYLKTFKNEKDAAKYYNEIALKYHGEFANLNIIEDDETE